jgi:hypothetical protein
VYYVASFTDMVAGVADMEHTYDLFASPLPPPGDPGGECGDPIADGSIAVAALPQAVTASDALFILRAGVGLGSCETCVCDVDGSGSITATDALLALAYAVGQPVELECPAC